MVGIKHIIIKQIMLNILKNISNIINYVFDTWVR